MIFFRRASISQNSPSSFAGCHTQKEQALLVLKL